MSFIQKLRETLKKIFKHVKKLFKTKKPHSFKNCKNQTVDRLSDDGKTIEPDIEFAQKLADFQRRIGID